MARTAGTSRVAKASVQSRYTLAAPVSAIVRRPARGGSIYAELGATGLKQQSGRIYEEFLPDLQGRRAVQIYREMSENDAVIGATLYALEMMMRRAKWHVDPAGPEAEYQKAAEHVQSCLDDMETSWGDTISDVLSFLRFGWSLHEEVFKLRRGQSRDPRSNSKYNDGLIGWRKLPIRAQETLFRWEIDLDTSDVLGMHQIPPPTYTERFVPLTKATLFRTSTYKGNPEGKSLLRSSYRSWYFKRRLEEIEAIGLERDLSGMPVLQPPEDIDIFDNENPKMVQTLADAVQMVTNIRRDELEGVVLPAGWTLALLSAGGSHGAGGSGGGGSRTGGGKGNIDGAITRYQQHTAMTLLADFILLGHEATGTYALAQPYTSRVITPTGFVPMGEIKVGDQVTDPLGATSFVSAIYEHGEREVYEVYFGDGRIVETADDHRWVVTTPYWRRQGAPSRARLPWAISAPEPYPLLPGFAILTTTQLQERLATSALRGATFEVPRVQPVEYAQAVRPLPIDPYLLGLILGDGWTADVAGTGTPLVTTGDPEIVAAIKGLVPTARVKTKSGSNAAVDVFLSCGTKGVQNRYARALHGLGLSGARAHYKFIPPSYQFAAVIDRIALLQGLMDSDGGCKNGQNIYSTISPQLADDVECLARGLGATSVYRHVRTHKECTIHLVDFDVAPGIVPFRLTRKSANYRAKYKTEGNKIAHVVATGRYEQMRCISVTAPSHLYLTDGFVPTHNSADKTDMFNLAVNAWLGVIAGTFNRYAIPRLLALNPSLAQDKLPTLAHNGVDTPNVSELGAFIQQMTGIGVLSPDPGLEDYVRSLANLPDRPEGETDEEWAARHAAMNAADGDPNSPNTTSMGGVPIAGQPRAGHKERVASENKSKFSERNSRNGRGASITSGRKGPQPGTQQEPGIGVRKADEDIDVEPAAPEATVESQELGEVRRGLAELTDGVRQLAKQAMNRVVRRRITERDEAGRPIESTEYHEPAGEN